MAILLATARALSRKAAVIGLLAALFAATVAVLQLLEPQEAASESIWDNPLVQALLILAFGAVVGWLVMHFGDVLRYLDPSPDNHKVREDLVSSGAALVKKLHHDTSRKERFIYDRIVVLGHSMGTSVAYDILVRCWQDMHADLPGSSEPAGARSQLESKIADLYSQALSDRSLLAPEFVEFTNPPNAYASSLDPFAPRRAYTDAKRQVLRTINYEAKSPPSSSK